MLLVLRYWRVGLLALVLAFVGLQQWRIDHLQTALAQEKQARVTETAQRERVAREHAEQIATIQATHAAQQQEKDDAYKQLQDTLARTRVVERARTDGLRNQLVAATARDREGPALDTASCERQADQHEELGRLAAEGVGLLQEGRELLAERDGQVNYLLGIIQNDRTAVEKAEPQP